MRSWHHGEDRKVSVRQAFARVGAPDGASPFGHFLDAARDGAYQALMVNTLFCRGVSEEELVLLDVLSLAQEGRTIEALLLLRGLLSPESAGVALDHAGCVGEALTRAGWRLRAPTPDMRHYALNGAGAGGFIPVPLG